MKDLITFSLLTLVAGQSYYTDNYDPEVCRAMMQNRITADHTYYRTCGATDEEFFALTLTNMTTSAEILSAYNKVGQKICNQRVGSGCGDFFKDRVNFIWVTVSFSVGNV